MARGKFLSIAFELLKEYSNRTGHCDCHLENPKRNWRISCVHQSASEFGLSSFPVGHCENDASLGLTFDVSSRLLSWLLFGWEIVILVKIKC